MKKLLEATVYLKTGKSFQVKYRPDFQLAAEDFTVEVLHTMPLADGDGVIFISGDQISYFYVPSEIAPSCH